MATKKEKAEPETPEITPEDIIEIIDPDTHEVTVVERHFITTESVNQEGSNLDTPKKETGVSPLLIGLVVLGLLIVGYFAYRYFTNEDIEESEEQD